MCKKIRRSALILTVLLSLQCLLASCSGIFSPQYNENGVSNYLNITIDKDQEKTFIASLDGHDVYIEGLEIEGTYFKTVDNQRLSVRQVIEEGKVSLEGWRSAAWKTRKEDGIEALLFENYEIDVSDTEAVIRPLSR